MKRYFCTVSSTAVSVNKPCQVITMRRMSGNNVAVTTRDFPIEKSRNNYGQTKERLIISLVKCQMVLSLLLFFL